jgi:hypothetical protein
MKLNQYETIFVENLNAKDNQLAVADYYQITQEEKQNLIHLNHSIQKLVDASDYNDKSLVSFLLDMDKKRVALASEIFKNFADVSKLKIVNDEATGQLKVGILAEIKPEYKKSSTKKPI